MNVISWLNRQTQTKSDFRPASMESDKIQKDLDELADRVDELKKPVEVSLEGSYDDLSAGRKLMLGAAGGAVVGGVLGAAHGLISPIGDKVELQVDWETQPIMEDTLRVESDRSQISGMSSQVTADGVIDVEVKGGVRYDFQHRIVQNQVGEYQTPGRVTAQRSDSSNPTVSGLIGLGVGAGVGLAATGAMMALKKITGDGEEVPSEPKEQKLIAAGETKRMAVFGAVGAAGGAGVGALAGWMEQNRVAGLTQEVTWETPVMEQTDIGTVPESASILIRQDIDFGDSLRNSQIYRDPSEFDLDDHMEDSVAETIKGTKPERGLLGGIKMEEQSQTHSIEPRTTVMASAVGGALVGGITGVAAAVCYNTLQRMIEA